MFGLFKSNTPEDKIKAEFNKTLNEELKTLNREINNNALNGHSAHFAINTTYIAFCNAASLLSLGHNIPLSEVNQIIKKCANEAFVKHLSNGKDFLIP